MTDLLLKDHGFLLIVSVFVVTCACLSFDYARKLRSRNGYVEARTRSTDRQVEQIAQRQPLAFNRPARKGFDAQKHGRAS